LGKSISEVIWTIDKIMIKFYFILVILLFYGCQKKAAVELVIHDEYFHTPDSLGVKIKNNTKENYLLFLNNRKLYYQKVQD
jgi:hypothetical protein